MEAQAISAFGTADFLVLRLRHPHSLHITYRHIGYSDVSRDYSVFPFNIPANMVRLRDVSSHALYCGVHRTMSGALGQPMDLSEMVRLYVISEFCSSPFDSVSIAFFGIMDLLSIFPYYLELMLHQDTVRPRTSRTRPSHECLAVNLVQIHNTAYISSFARVQAIPLQQYHLDVRPHALFECYQL